MDDAEWNKPSTPAEIEDDHRCACERAIAKIQQALAFDARVTAPSQAGRRRALERALISIVHDLGYSVSRHAWMETKKMERAR